MCPAEDCSPPSAYDSAVLDGGVVVHMLTAKSVCTLILMNMQIKFFVPYLISQLQSSSRVDVVWDTYKADSPKESTREKRGKGLQRKVSRKTEIPSNWMDFLHDQERAF